MATDLRQRFAQYQARFQQLDRRQRLLYSLVALLLIAVPLFSRGSIPLWQQQQQQQQQRALLQQQLLEQQQTTAALQQALQKDPNEALQAQRQQLQQQLQSIEQRLQQQPGMVPASQRRLLLGAVLDAAAPLSINRVNAMPAQVQIQAGDDSVLYQHGLQLTVRGDYFQVRDFLRQVEALPWSTHWRSINYKVLDYPQGEAVIELYTVSTDKEFVGV
ncbi:hypothetical protein [Idiomarina xiamenensis]|uniref:MSHA biogenesis protein MshJ n=1 Tax=Idiomarina xiamenensis 10-D-4 TaxID=740709 RepID=K2L6J0_9GAMM|nr:hypothetical protein [Idiomarina xiamenensis]EKE85410.1 MSHA biogenesis protein MshJ [Idiomarina xiamenensis 10-D-4]